jgi:NAD(P)-dependent dehydrogenase (short-subunit alcohol dehydrogenase family)
MSLSPQAGYGLAQAGSERSHMSDPETLALVIGGGSGIGAALAEAYRTRGTPTVTWDIAGSHDVTCDVTEPEKIDQAVRATRSRWGVPTELTVTAGVGHAGLLADTAADEFDRVMRVNARGPWLCMRAWIGAMHERGVAGSLVAVSSVSARLVDRNMGLYCASKAALSMLVQVAAAEWGELGLRVNAVAPGVTRTPMLGRGPSATTAGSPWLAGVAARTALGRLGEAGDIAETILGLHAMEWVTGQVLDCDGGLALHSPVDSWGEMQRASARTAAPTR